MSLAMYAAPFNEINNDKNDNDNIIYKKRQHNKTQKIYGKENFDTNKVKSMLEAVHKKYSDKKEGSTDEEEEDESGMGDFNPPSKPESSGVEKTRFTDEKNMKGNEQTTETFRTLGKAPEPNSDNADIDLNDYKLYGNEQSSEEYYKKMLPNYNSPNRPYYNRYNEGNYNKSNNQQDVLLQKLNYMIHLLEEQQDEKTNNVTEEVVLYSFLGIFVIFIVDSFVRVGKYVR
jgi:hypothetical protein